jgi:hypothetical protein
MGHVKVKLDEWGEVLTVETDYEHASIDHKFIQKSVLKRLMKVYGIRELEADVPGDDNGEYAIKKAFDEEIKKTSFSGMGYFDTFGFVEL